MLQATYGAYAPAPHSRFGAVRRVIAMPLRHPLLSDIDWNDLELTVDLGHRIGSRRWWQGLTTLFLLMASMLVLGLRITPLPVPVAGGFDIAPPREIEAQRIAPLAQGGQMVQPIAPTKAVTRLSQAPERPRIDMTVSLRAIDSFSGAMRRAGVGSKDSAALNTLLSPVVKLSQLKPGTDFDLVLGRRDKSTDVRPLEHLAFRAAFDLKVEVNRDAQGTLILKKIPIAVDSTPLRVSGKVGSSLFKSARAAGLPDGIVARYIKELGHVIDFQRDVRGSDKFDIIVEHRRAATGETETGDILYAALDGHKKIEMMRWAGGGGRAMYFDAKGASLKAGLMRTPVDGARMSSGFGMRLHPILGYSRLHKGVDFAAGTGTPIMAAASGTIVYAGVYKGYGNHIRIRHANGIETSYSHMSGFARGATRGARVEQGQVIGYVGSTGLSTGPHLHYEVYLRGVAVNPSSAKLPTGLQLGGRELSRFKAELARLRGMKITGTADAVTQNER